MRNILKKYFDVDGQVVIWRNHNCDCDFRNHDHDEKDFDDFEKLNPFPGLFLRNNADDDDDYYWGG